MHGYFIYYLLGVVVLKNLALYLYIMNKQSALTPTQQREYICETISELTHDDVVSTYKFMSTMVQADLVSIHSNGCSINLDNIQNNIVEYLYNYIWALRNA